MTNRQLKKKIRVLLNQNDMGDALGEIKHLPARQVVNPLFSFFYSHEEQLRWRSISAMGAVVSGLTQSHMEYARVVMRRLIWNLNDESGGIGWGSPEAMGEIMARNNRLAREYSNILISYIRPDGNFLEHDVLQRGVLWGLGRLAYARPCLLTDAIPFFRLFLASDDALHRGLSAWIMGAFSSKVYDTFLVKLVRDNTKIKIYIDMALVECTVGRMARYALKKSNP